MHWQTVYISVNLFSWIPAAIWPQIVKIVRHLKSHHFMAVNLLLKETYMKECWFGVTLLVDKGLPFSLHIPTCKCTGWHGCPCPIKWRHRINCTWSRNIYLDTHCFHCSTYSLILAPSFYKLLQNFLQRPLLMLRFLEHITSCKTLLFPIDIHYPPCDQFHEIESSNPTGGAKDVLCSWVKARLKTLTTPWFESHVKLVVPCWSDK